MDVRGFDTLVLYDQPHRPTGLRAPAERAGLAIVTLPEDPAAVEVVPAAGRAWRCPPGFVERLQAAGHAMPVTGAPATWICELPDEALGRRLITMRASELLRAAEPALPVVASVKLATHKLRSQAIQRTSSWEQARTWTAQLPADYAVLLADRWLDLHSEYRVFTVGRDAVAASPYLVEGEPWSSLLTQHRASFHDQAQLFITDLLASLPADWIPPAAVLDVGRLDRTGQLVVLEVNTTWGAGLYGCDPAAVLEAVLAANLPADPRWSWRP